mmetsp:Transcript_27829/g.93587  ORF Transcript_27829/g.93587 Transcript_27829/m.93587 type:complete len:226 (-) Transcript_27829:464-1141(-)
MEPSSWPKVSISPSSTYEYARSAGARVCAASDARTLRAATTACCSAICADGAEETPATDAASPKAKTFLAPLSRSAASTRSGPLGLRPTLQLAGMARTAGATRAPAVQITISTSRHSMRPSAAATLSAVLPALASPDDGATWTTDVPRRTPMPRCSSAARPAARFESVAAGSTPERSTSETSSQNAVKWQASSTPVYPAPTMRMDDVALSSVASFALTAIASARR